MAYQKSHIVSTWKGSSSEIRGQRLSAGGILRPSIILPSDDEDINRVWENIKENIKPSAKESLGLHELKQHKPWFDEECLHFLDERKQAKLQWVQD